MTDIINQHIIDNRNSNNPITTPHFTMGDGQTVSIQASPYHYCTPREPHGPYTHFEVWCWPETDIPDEFKPYASDDDPATYVPLDVVLAYAARHSEAKVKGD